MFSKLSNAASKMITVSKNVFFKGYNKTGEFIKTPFGAAITSGLASAYVTHMLSKTQIYQERDAAKERQQKAENALQSSTLIIENLHDRLDRLSDEKHHLSSSLFACQHSQSEYNRDIMTIVLMHDNTWFFKPDISIVAEKHRKNGGAHNNPVEINVSLEKPPTAKP